MTVPKQKFHRGDRVRIAKDLGPSMSHFSGKGEEALVVGSYVDLCHAHVNSPRDTELYQKYELMLLPRNGTPYTVAWYYESQLTRVKGPRGKALLNSFMRVPFG